METLGKGEAGYALRLGIFFGAVFLVVGTYLPFFPVWLKSKGLGAEQIGVILAAPLIVRVFFAPVISFLADYFGDHRMVLIMLGWGTLFFLGVLFFADGFWQLFFVSIGVAVFWTSIMPLSDVVAMAGMRRAGIDYGRVRIWGSVTFILASFLGGLLLEAYGASYSYWLIFVSSLAVIAAAYLLPKPKGLGRLKAATVGPKLKTIDALKLARSPYFLIFLFTTSFVQTSHAVVYGFGTLHWQGLGISAGTIGLLWGTGVVAEIVLFLFARRLFSQAGAAWLLFAAALAGMVRWTVTSLDPALLVLFGCQILHGFTFGAAHLASVDFVSKSIPEQYTGTALGLYAAITAGVSMGFGTIAAGWLYGGLGKDAYLVMAVLCFFGLIGSWVLIRGWRGEPLLD